MKIARVQPARSPLPARVWGSRIAARGGCIYISASMLDLGYLRDHLELVEEKLRQRGMDPSAVLGRFRELDDARRKHIGAVESAQQRRNQLSQRMGELKRNKAPGDAERA